MRKNLLVFMFLFSLAGIAQQNGRSDSPIVIEQLPPEGILLDKGWRFKAGDNPAFAGPTVDNSQWQHLDPTKDIRELPQVQQGVGWFRIRFSFASSETKQPLALVIQQSGASEVYINGRLLRKYGNVSSEGKKVLAYDPSGKPLPQTKEGDFADIIIRLPST